MIKIIRGKKLKKWKIRKIPSKRRTPPLRELSAPIILEKNSGKRVNNFCFACAFV